MVVLVLVSRMILEDLCFLLGGDQKSMPSCPRLVLLILTTRAGVLIYCFMLHGGLRGCIDCLCPTVSQTSCWIVVFFSLKRAKCCVTNQGMGDPVSLGIK